MNPTERVISRDLRVGVLLGGMSSERAISLKSGHAVTAALRRRGWDAVELDAVPNLPSRLLAENIGVVWIALHGRFGEDGCVQGLLEVMRIPYTGSGPLASAVAMDKIVTKSLLTGTDVLLPSQVSWSQGDPMPEIDLPVVVKTPAGGSTIGTVVCHTRAEFDAGITECLRHASRVLIEKYVSGREVTVAVLDGQPLPVVGIEPDSGFFDFEAKYTKGRTRYVVPADLEPHICLRAQAHAAIVARVLGLCGVSRADFIVDDEGRPWFLEVNTVPGMTETSLSPMAAGVVGITFDDLVERVLLGARLHLDVAAP